MDFGISGSGDYYVIYQRKYCRRFIFESFAKNLDFLNVKMLIYRFWSKPFVLWPSVFIFSRGPSGETL